MCACGVVVPYLPIGDGGVACREVSSARQHQEEPPELCHHGVDGATAVHAHICHRGGWQLRREPTAVL